jgi:hypothetical protein
LIKARRESPLDAFKLSLSGIRDTSLEWCFLQSRQELYT